MPTSSAGFFSRGGLGLPSHAVKLTPYNPEWPLLFQDEKARLLALLEKVSPQVEHIGSTSISGMDAKPVIDIMVGISGPHEIDFTEEVLMRRGYISHGEKGIPGRLFFTYGEPPKLHLHLVRYDGGHWRGHLRFREALRTDMALARKYVQLKEQLAAQFPIDRQSYTAGKADFIERVVRQTRTQSFNVEIEREKTPL